MQFLTTLNAPPITKSLVIILIIELFLGVLILLNPMLAFLAALGIISLGLFYYTFLNGPFIWIVIMLVTSGLDSWGRVGGGITLFHLSWFMAILSTGIYYLQNPEENIIINTPINKYAIIFFLFAALSLIYSPNYVDGFRLLGTSFALFISYIIFVNFLNSDLRLKITVFTLAAINIFLSVLTFYQLMFQNVLYFGTTTVATESGEKVWRATGTFEDPNMTASFIMVGVIFSFAILLFGKTKKWEKLFLITSIILSFIGIFSTFSRSGLLTVILGVFLLFFFIKNKKLILLVLLGVMATILGFIFLSPYGEFLTSRSLSIFDVMKDPSIKVRIYMAVSSIWMFIDYPLLGIGFRGYPMLYDFYIHPEAPQILLYVKESHTLWTTLLAELGIIGFTIVVLWFVRVFKDSFKLTRSLTDFKGVMAIGAFVMFLSFNINFIFYGNMFPHFNLIWLNLAIIYSLKLNFIDKK